MRPELEFIARIEEYLNNTLSSEDRKVFEERLATDKKLQREVELQRELMEGIQLHGLRHHIRSAKHKHFLKKKLLKLGIISSIIVAVTAIGGFLLFNPVNHGNDENHLPAPIHQDGAAKETPSVIHLDAQEFNIPNNADHVIETAEGIVFIIPENAFEREDGVAVTNSIQIQVKEALSAASIIKAGLSTTSNGELLETAGMFEFKAYNKGVELQIKRGKEVLVDLPSNSPAINMQLFDGEPDSTNNINWVNPKPIENFLTTVPINSLDFYPLDFLDSLAMFGYNVKNKALTDSVFYSYYCGLKLGVQSLISTSEVRNEEVYLKSMVAKGLDVTDANYDGMKNLQRTVQKERTQNSLDKAMYLCGIEPSDVRAIWNEKFQDTFIATKEFEERITYMYETCSGNALDIYINHLDEPLFISDSLASRRFDADVRSGEGYKYGTFYEFYQRKNGRVRLNDRLAEKLSDHYQQKRSRFLKATKDANKKTWDKQRELDKKNNVERKGFSIKEQERINQNWKIEFELNLTEAYRQLGYSRPRFNTKPNQSFSFPIRNTGWKNVDKFVGASTTNRSTLDYTDPNGKKAVIKYEPLSVKLSGLEDVARIHVYLLGDKQSSFRRIYASNEFYIGRLNELINYHFLAVAYKGDECFLCVQENITSGTFELSLSATTESELNNRINSLSGKQTQTDLTADFAFKKQKTKRRADVYLPDHLPLHKALGKLR
ncbi:MAG: hypothetical protein ACI898_000417 [Flavobacteriales bacterium]|jgi:hypothetical protein